MPSGPRSPRFSSGSSTGLARALSKLGICSRQEAWRRIEAGRVRLNGTVCRDPERRVFLGRDRIELDEQKVEKPALVYLMLNKPRGLVTTVSDEQGRATVFQCLEGKGFPYVAPVGRLDQASEGLLLFTNDSQWAARVTDPNAHVEKTYHVQINRLPDAEFWQSLRNGVEVDGERLQVKKVSLLREGGKNCWLCMVLDEGRNRHIRRLLQALGVEVLRLVRVAIGALELGPLPKGEIRPLTPQEISKTLKR